MSDWQHISTAPEGIEIMTRILDEKGERGIQSLKLCRRQPSSQALWWFPDMSMYVYYTPTHWKPMEGRSNG